ncbi:MAG: RNA polymerase sigma factor [Bacteroidota bacterium]
MSTTEFTANFDRITSALQSFAYSLTSDSAKAQDLFQETALRALSNKDKFHIGTNFKAWVMTMMKNIFINDYRMRRRRATQSEPTGSYLLDNNSGIASNGAVSNLTSDELMKLLNELNEQYRVPFWKYYTGFSYQEIADELGKPLGTIKSRIHHARKSLQDKISNRYELRHNRFAA